MLSIIFFTCLVKLLQWTGKPAQLSTAHSVAPNQLRNTVILVNENGK